MAEEFVRVYTGYGHLDAETVRLFLESKGIRAISYGESAGQAIGLTIGMLGEVDVFVPESQAEEADRLLTEMEEGKFDSPQLLESPGDDLNEADADDEPD